MVSSGAACAAVVAVAVRGAASPAAGNGDGVADLALHPRRGELRDPCLIHQGGVASGGDSHAGNGHRRPRRHCRGGLLRAAGVIVEGARLIGQGIHRLAPGGIAAQVVGQGQPGQRRAGIGQGHHIRYRVPGPVAAGYRRLGDGQGVPQLAGDHVGIDLAAVVGQGSHVGKGSHRTPPGKRMGFPAPGGRSRFRIPVYAPWPAAVIPACPETPARSPQTADGAGWDGS